MLQVTLTVRHSLEFSFNDLKIGQFQTIIRGGWRRRPLYALVLLLRLQMLQVTLTVRYSSAFLFKDVETGQLLTLKCQILLFQLLDHLHPKCEVL
jgi:hypothetical protein